MAGRVASIVLACGILSATIGAEQRPDFSGSWRGGRLLPGSLLAEGTGNANRNGTTDNLRWGRFPSALEISHDNTTLTVEEQYDAGGGGYPYHTPRTVVTYALIGGRVTNQVPIAPITGSHVTAPAEFMCRWEDKVLVADLSVSIPEEPTAVRYERRIWLTDQGELAMKTLRIGTPHSLTIFFIKRVKK